MPPKTTKAVRGKVNTTEESGTNWTISLDNVRHYELSPKTDPVDGARAAVSAEVDKLTALFGRPVTVALLDALDAYSTAVVRRAQDAGARERQSIEQVLLWKQRAGELAANAEVLGDELMRRERKSGRAMSDDLDASVGYCRSARYLWREADTSSRSVDPGCCEGSSMPAGDQ